MLAQWAIRGIFLLITAGTGWQVGRLLSVDPLLSVLVAVGLFATVAAAEVFFFRGAIADLSAIIFGVLAGSLMAWLFYQVGTLMMEPGEVARYGPALRVSLLALFCYLMVMIIYKTRDKFHFVIPYVEFRRQRRGPKPILLDASAIIDGRVAAVLEAWPPDASVVASAFTIEEVQRLADSPDRTKRLRGQRGLDMLDRLRTQPTSSFTVDDTEIPSAESMDAKLVGLAQTLDARILTVDSSLAKVARLQDVEVLRLDQLARALRPVALPGEQLSLELLHEGEGRDQAVGYLEDGTMVVAENGRSHLGEQAHVVVTKVLQTSGGRLIFGRLK